MIIYLKLHHLLTITTHNVVILIKSTFNHCHTHNHCYLKKYSNFILYGGVLLNIDVYMFIYNQHQHYLI